MDSQPRATRNREISKFLSYVLRHQPDSIGVTLDQAGWIDVTELLAAARKHGQTVRHEELLEVVANNDKQRFALSADQKRIRASQGHSIAVDLAHSPRTPPDLLFHGTVARFLDSIRREGLRPMKRQHVHLSGAQETAKQVGSRRGKPVILTVASGQMHREGHAFFQSGNGVWLVEAVPIGYISGAGDAESVEACGRNP